MELWQWTYLKYPLHEDFGQSEGKRYPAYEAVGAKTSGGGAIAVS
jgi:hypothetical protein